MTPAQVITLGLDNSFTTTAQFPAPKQIEAFNLAHRDVVSKIMTFIDERFFWDIFRTDAVANALNGEYLMPLANSTSQGLLKIEEVYIKPTPTSDFVKCQEVDPRSLDHDFDWYLENQPIQSPIFYIADKSYFIAPNFKASNLPTVPAGNKQIKLTGIKNVVDLTITAVEADILVPVEYHHVISKLIEPYAFNYRGKRQDAITSEQQGTVMIKTMIQELTNRYIGMVKATLPNNDNLAYGE